ncbi:hypothetical protein EIK56_17535 [Sphingomonas sp. C8-2]|jgi:hypothetical protein|nr:hypothetical protein EIK56_17535 [Sphingomonas sp. C8-2]
MANFLVIDDSPSAVAAWLKATKALSISSRPVYNLIYSISDPTMKTASEKAIIKVFDKFALEHKFRTTDTVSNTIFPLDTYQSQIKNGSDEFYEYYLDVVLPKVRKVWGTYFERMTVRYNDDNTPMMRGDRRLNPLDVLIEKLKGRIENPPKTTTHYEVSLDDIALEIATYNPRTDGKYNLGGPCLSHISFKIDRDAVLRLSAFYRSHWYIERALGNLIGLSRLQCFVAQCTGAKVGPLTIIAAEAVLDLGAKNRKASDTRALLAECWKSGGIT